MILIDYDLYYAKQGKLSAKELRAINSVRLQKGIIYPFKLVGFNQNKITNMFLQNKGKLLQIRMKLVKIKINYGKITKRIGIFNPVALMVKG